MIVAVDFTERELWVWCIDNDVRRRDVIKADRLEQVLGLRGPGRLIVGHTAVSAEGVIAEARRRGFVTQ